MSPTKADRKKAHRVAIVVVIQACHHPRAPQLGAGEYAEEPYDIDGDAYHGMLRDYRRDLLVAVEKMPAVAVIEAALLQHRRLWSVPAQAHALAALTDDDLKQLPLKTRLAHREAVRRFTLPPLERADTERFEAECEAVQARGFEEVGNPAELELALTVGAEAPLVNVGREYGHTAHFVPEWLPAVARSKLTRARREQLARYLVERPEQQTKLMALLRLAATDEGGDSARVVETYAKKKVLAPARGRTR
jgi:hypothetical protein